MSGASESVARRISPALGSEQREVTEKFACVLDVLGRRLSASIQEAEQECAAVGRAFVTAKSRLDAIVCHRPECAVLREDAAQIGASLDAAVVGLQYHDRLAQRVGHIGAALHQLQQVLGDGTERSDTEWLQLLYDVEKSHWLEQERLVADGIGSHGSAELF
jgi:hypothetical protein